MLEFLKRALCLQSLFFGHWALAQTIFIASPRPGEPLENPQEFQVGFSGEAPERIEFYLNGKLSMARTKPPFHFQITWNTRFENQVELVAYYTGGEPVRVSQRYNELRTDVEASVQAFQCFPFLESSPEQTELISGNILIEPQKFEPADKFELQLTIALDVSGSMRHALPDMSAPMHAFLSFCERKGYRIRFFTFDSKPTLFESERIPANLERLYRAEESSIVWDAAATATSMFDVGPRRIVLLISDGVDDGSEHNPATVERYLYETDAVLIWLNPTKLSNQPLARLAGISGGFTLFNENNDPWPILTQRMDRQYYLLAPNARFPISLKVSPGSVWYPLWRQ